MKGRIKYVTSRPGLKNVPQIIGNPMCMLDNVPVPMLFSTMEIR